MIEQPAITGTEVRKHRVLPVLLLACALMLITAAPAAAQTLPDICEQYPDLPQCEQPTDREGPPTPVPGGDDDEPGGQLPFTGYPLTPAVLLALLLLLLALAIRTAIAIRDHWNARGAVADGDLRSP